jgi:hypothetical protein
MQVEIHIQDQLYKTVDLGPVDTYNISELVLQCYADREAGLITNIDISSGFKIEIVPLH